MATTRKDLRGRTLLKRQDAAQFPTNGMRTLTQTHWEGASTSMQTTCNSSRKGGSAHQRPDGWSGHLRFRQSNCKLCV